MRQRNNRRPSAGFTLVELLVAITVIAILAAMAIPAIMGVLTRAHETAVVTEISQLDMAMEQFKSEYGFYPPSFESDVTSVGQLMSYVTRMSPNNAEASFLSGTVNVDGVRRIEHWWNEVGRYLDQESSLVFWLSGVCKNKQYPITGMIDVSAWESGVPPLAAHSLNFENDGLERDSFFEFNTGQIVADETVLDKTGTPVPGNQIGFIAEYRQPHAGDDGDEFTSPDGTTGVTDYRYRYRSAISYPGYSNGAGADVAYHGPTGKYANPSRFQIISFGMDGLPGVPGDWNNINAGTVTIDGTDFYGPWGADNLTNFANGRLEKWVIENE